MSLETLLMTFFAMVASGVVWVLTGSSGMGTSHSVLSPFSLFQLIAAIVAAAFFYRKGLANLRLMVLAAVPYIVFVKIGQFFMFYEGDYGYGIRLLLGFLAVIIALAFAFGGRVEYPEVKQVDSFTNKLGLAMSYEEKSLDKRIDYWPVRAPLVVLLFSVAGFVSGMFYLANWLMVPIFAFGMLVPLKVAVICSMIVNGVTVNVISLWSPTGFSNVEGFKPAIAVVGSIATVIGTLAGAHIMLRARAWIIRLLVAIILLISGAELIHHGINTLGLM